MFFLLPSNVIKVSRVIRHTVCSIGRGLALTRHDSEDAQRENAGGNFGLQKEIKPVNGWMWELIGYGMAMTCW